MSQNSKKFNSRTNSIPQSSKSLPCSLLLSPYSSSMLQEQTLKQVDDGWRAICSKSRFLTLSIPETYQNLFDDGMKPKPFPLLPNLFEKNFGDEEDHVKNEYIPPTRMTVGVTEVLQRTQSFQKNPSYFEFQSNSSHRSLSASCSRTRQSSISPSTQYRDRAGHGGRPVSAPQTKTKSFNSDSSQKRSTSASRVNNLGKNNEAIHQNVPGDIEDEGVPNPYKKESMHAIHLRRRIPNVNDNSRNLTSQRSGVGLNKDGEDVNRASSKSKNSQGKGQGQTTVTEKLLNGGRTTADKSKLNNSSYLHEVAEKLHSLVMVELQVLREENERLGLENMKLKDQAVIDTTSRRSGRGVTLHRITASPVQLIKLPGDPQIRSVSVPRTEQSQNEDLTEKVDILEKTVTLLMDQIGKIQDRLYQQEIRYEDTLGKFDDIVAQLTKKLDQATSTSDGTTPELLETLSQLGEATEQLTSITKSNRKVQFKGILKK